MTNKVQNFYCFIMSTGILPTPTLYDQRRLTVLLGNAPLVNISRNISLMKTVLSELTERHAQGLHSIIFRLLGTCSMLFLTWQHSHKCFWLSRHFTGTLSDITIIINNMVFSQGVGIAQYYHSRTATVRSTSQLMVVHSNMNMKT